MQTGDVVAGKYNGETLLFTVDEKLKGGYYKVRCLNYRLVAIMHKQSLEKVSDNDIRSIASLERDIGYSKINKILSERIKDLDKKIYRVKVLHIDSDKSYLKMCLNAYEKLGIEANGEYLPVERQPIEIYNILKKYKPDILVITGHDVLKSTENAYDLLSYENSKFFVETIKLARKYNASKTELVIIAGACQSYYEEIIKAGANFGSSPKRVLIHALDPVLVAEKIVYTHITEIVDGKKAVKNTISGEDGFGGIDTFGTYRSIYPTYNIFDYNKEEKNK